MKPTVLLFDIDGTLVTTGGAGRRAIIRTFAELHGRPDACAGFHFGGMTDRAIMRGGLSAIGQTVTDGTITALLSRYVQVLEQEVAAADATHYRVHPGMRDAVQAGLDAGMAVGLGTGNLEAGARIKLRRVQLDTAFRFGGFGDDSELRPELIRAGAQRGAAQLGLPLPEVRVVVIGDTPKDIAAAQAIGAKSLAVATGGFELQQLRALGPTWAFQDLSVEGALAALLGA